MNFNKKLLGHFGGSPEVTIPKPHFLWPIYDDRHKKAILSVLEKGELNEYEEEEGLMCEVEKKIRDYHGVKHCLLNSNCTSSLFSAFFALGIKPGDEVIVPNFTFIKTVSPLLFFGAKLKFIDCDINTGNININELKKVLSDKTKLLVVTHNWGVPNDMDSIMELKNKFGFHLVEDCARALGTEYKGKKVGTFGDVGCFSFGEKKIVPGGEGGCAITNSKDLYEKMIYLGHYFKCKVDVHTELDYLKQYRETGLGLKFTISPFTAAIVNLNFDSLDKNIISRYHSYEFLAKKLNDFGIKSVKLTKYPDYANLVSIYHYVLMYDSKELNNYPKDKFIDLLNHENVDIRMTDNKPLTSFNIFNEDGLKFYPNKPIVEKANEYINCDQYYRDLLLIPPIIDENLLLQYVKAIKKIETYIINSNI